MLDQTFFGVASFAAYGLASSGTLFLAGVLLYAPLGLVNPALQGIMTRRVSPSEQGQLQGANASILGLTGINRTRAVHGNIRILHWKQGPVQAAGRTVHSICLPDGGSTRFSGQGDQKEDRNKMARRLINETIVP